MKDELPIKQILESPLESPISQSNENYLQWMISHIIQHKSLFISNVVGLILVTIGTLIIPIRIGEIIDDLISPSVGINWILMLAILLGLYLIRNFLEYGTWMIGHKLGSKVEQSMRKEFFDTMQQKSLSFYDQLRTGDLQALATNDLRIINTMIAHGSFYIYPFFHSVITVVILIQAYGIGIGFFSIPFLMLYIYYILDYRKKLTPYSKGALRKHADITVNLQDSIKGAEVTHAYSAHGIETRKFKQVVQAFRDNWLQENRIQARFYPMLVLYLTIGVSFVFSCLLIYLKVFSVGELTGLNLLLITFIEPTNMIFWATKDMIGGFGATERLHTILNKDTGEISHYSKHSQNEIADWNSLPSDIRFEHVSFSYQRDGEKNRSNLVLRDVSFSIEPYQQVALIGPTGCGKSTLVKMLQRFYSPHTGTILLGGYSLEDLPLDIIRKKIAYIEQDIFLFSQTIADNIRFGNPSASDEEVIQAAKLAHVDDFVSKLPLGYNTLVGERGTRLSGGEKQRIAIARAFLVDPEIIILDDSMSAIDSETEEKIGKAIDNILQNRTTLIITHRLHTIRNSDKILVMKRGSIVAQGDHHQLIETSNDYRRIFGMVSEEHSHTREQPQGEDF